MSGSAPSSKNAWRSCSPKASTAGQGTPALASFCKVCASRVDLETKPKPAQELAKRSRNGTRCSFLRKARGSEGGSSTFNTWRSRWPHKMMPGRRKKSAGDNRLFSCNISRHAALVLTQPITMPFVGLPGRLSATDVTRGLPTIRTNIRARFTFG